MYQTLLSFDYRHEYYDYKLGLDMHCRFTKPSTKLSQAMDVVLITKQGGFSLVWNDESYTRKNLLDTYAGESLTIVIYPYEPELFFNITDNFPISMEVTTVQHEPKQTKNSPCLHLTVVEKESGNQLSYENEPAEKLLYVDELKEVGSITQSDLSTGKKKRPMHPEISSVYELIKRKSVIILTIPIDHLNLEIPEQFSLNFPAKSVIYKYYFTSLSANDDYSVQADVDEGNSSNIGFRSAEPYFDRGAYVPTFISESPIKLADQPAVQYRLVLQKNGTEEVVIETLPQPKVDSLYKHDQPKQEPITVLEAFII